MIRQKGYFTKLAQQYATDVISGKKIACKLTILACERFINDLGRQNSDDFPYIYSHSKAEHACQFMEYQQHVEGPLVGKTFDMEPWQAFIYCNIFGWINIDTRMRRFRRAYVEVPRKNGKSFKACGVANYCGLADGEGGAKVYIAASDHRQASLCFNNAKAMITKDEDLCNYFGVETNKFNIYVPCTNSNIKALPKDRDGSLDGLNVHCAIIDELHAHPNSKTYEALSTGMGARTQPLLFAITTAGFNRTAICYEQRSYVKKILEGVYKDESYFGIIYTIDEGDDWTDEKSWFKANPNMGVSINLEHFRNDCLAAQNQTTKQNHFLTKHLNVWVGSHIAWLDMNKWEQCKDETMTEEDCKGMDLFTAVDLASVTDFCSVANIYTNKVKTTGPDGADYHENHYKIFCKHFLNENAIDNAKIEEVRIWAEEGRIEKTPGNATSFRIIQNYIEEIASSKKPVMIGFDKYQAEQMMQELEGKNIKTITSFPQSVATMSQPMKEIEAAVLSGRLKHNGDPVLTWMISNVIARIDAKDNIYPNRDKNARHQKIDGAVACIMAMGLTMKEKPRHVPVKLYF